VIQSNDQRRLKQLPPPKPLIQAQHLLIGLWERLLSFLYLELPVIGIVTCFSKYPTYKGLRVQAQKLASLIG